MSVNLFNGASLTTASNSVIGANQDRAAFAVRFRLNSAVPLKWADYNGAALLQRSNGQGVGVTAYGVDEATQILKLICVWRTAIGGCSAVVSIYPNITYWLVMGYDKDNPSNQFASLNGLRTLMSGPKDAPLLATANNFMLGAANGGTYSRNFQYADLMWWNDYVPTPVEEMKILDGLGNPVNLGKPTAFRGWWKLDSPSTGLDASPSSPVIQGVKAGDAALANAIDGTFPLVPSIHPAVPGSSLSYGDALPFVSQSGFETPMVCSSGKAIQLPVVMKMTGAAVALTAGSVTIMPTIKINDGPPVALVRPLYSDHHEAILYYLPKGVKIVPGDVVRFSAPTGFFSTPFGVADGVEGLLLDNRAGRPKYEDEIDAKEFRLGGQPTYPGDTYYSTLTGSRNLAFRMLVDNRLPTPPLVRADGSLRQNYSGPLLQSNAGNGIDKLSYPLEYGLYAVGWDGNPAKPTTISIGSGMDGWCVERPEYRNPGDANGKGIVKVFEVGRKYWPVKLVAPCGPADVILSVDTVANLVGEGKMWVKFDDEYMEISKVNVAAKQITVVRQIFDTTAASHAKDVVGQSTWHRTHAVLTFSIVGTNGEPDYSNLVMYGPTDWVQPETPGPVVLDTSIEYQKSPSQFIRDIVSGGMGNMRYMDICGAFFPNSEPEHMRLDSDFYRGYDAKLFRAITIDKLRQPPASFYTYNHFGDGETYTATLAADVTTAPASGTPDKITIRDAYTAPVVVGSRIKLDDEWVYVTKVDYATGVCDVVRGAMLTTPATHKAGPVTVGWRVLINSPAQYRQSAAVGVIARTTQPHELMSGIWGGGPPAVDLNPMARFPVTLKAATVVGGKSIKVDVPADKWQYVARDLLLTFENETMSVVAADPATGVVTVKAGITTVHASGVVGKATATGVLCVSEDGLDRSWSPRASGSTPFFVTGPDTLLVSLYCYVGNADKVAVMVGDEQAWDATPQVVAGVDQKQIRWALPFSLWPIEQSARITKLSPGADHMVNVPLLASDDMVIAMARKLRDILPAGKHRVFVELANEVWNWLFPFVGPIYGFSKQLGYSAAREELWPDWWVLRQAAVTKLFERVFDEGGRHRGSEVKLMLAYQGGNLDFALSRARALGVDVDVASTAPYVAPDPSPPVLAAFRDADPEQACDTWIFNLQYDKWGVGARLRTDKRALAKHRAETGGRKIEMHCYEGGVASALPIPPNGLNDASVMPFGIERNRDLLYNPNWFYTDQDFIRVLKKIGDVDGACWFNLGQVPARLPKGSGYYDEMWGIYYWHGHKPGRGDGSDGLADNTKCLWQPGLPNSRHPSVTPDEVNVSVRGYSMIYHNKKCYAQPAPPPVEPEDPGRPYKVQILGVDETGALTGHIPDGQIRAIVVRNSATGAVKFLMPINDPTVDIAVEAYTP